MDGISNTYAVSLARKEAAEQVLAVMEGEGPQPGSFTESLILTMAKADRHNLLRLRGAFPYLGDAFGEWKRGGKRRLRKWSEQ